ncbi:MULTISPECIES: hypothetical protein [Arthrobacter]|uniref:Uncharacterized protein n=2 Tax=Arthrobacter TaxID=1663 RepID=A0ABU9KLY0_9MICC|nr:hypothetical protein [Arthrobacter sp. YJM1]MDP5228163.1 hypothetical protein [Arthrobacter sp. YJM1]
MPAWQPEVRAPARVSSPSSTGDPGLAGGTLLALGTVPLGVLAWALLWNAHVISSVVAFAVSLLAAQLYIIGSRHRVTRTGAWVVMAITVLTMALSFLAGMWLDMIDVVGGHPFAWIGSSGPWEELSWNLSENREYQNEIIQNLWSSLLFGGLGCFFTLRRLFAATKGR